MRTHRPDGYIYNWIDNKNVLEHIAIVEKAIGRKLRKGEEVHHVNRIRSDNRPGNLVLCPNKKYHELLHIRTKALDKSGNANFRSCKFCKKFDDPKNLHEVNSIAGNYHKECRNNYQRKWRTLKCQQQH